MPNSRLKELRLSRGLKQSDMARFLGIATNTYCEKENGNRKISIEEAIAISNIFDKKIEEIFLK